MVLKDFTFSNARPFYLSMGNPSGVKGLRILRMDIGFVNITWISLRYWRSQKYLGIPWFASSCLWAYSVNPSQLSDHSSSLWDSWMAIWNHNHLWMANTQFSTSCKIPWTVSSFFFSFSFLLQLCFHCCLCSVLQEHLAAQITVKDQAKKTPSSSYFSWN